MLRQIKEYKAQLIIDIVDEFDVKSEKLLITNAKIGR